MDRVGHDQAGHQRGGQADKWRRHDYRGVQQVAADDVDRDPVGPEAVAGDRDVHGAGGGP